MKTVGRLLSLAPAAALAASLWLGAPALAQSPYTAAAAADRLEAEERYRRLNALLEELQATLEAQRRRLDALVSEVQSLRNDAQRRSQQAVSREEFQQYVEQLRQLDEKREADRKLILGELAKLASAPPAKPDSTKDRSTASASAKPEEFIEYEVKPGDTVSAIVAACREQGLKVTVAQIAAANPKLNVDVVRPGQKILIPKPAKATP
jgi:LysM repeat protein